MDNGGGWLEILTRKGLRAEMAQGWQGALREWSEGSEEVRTQAGQAGSERKEPPGCMSIGGSSKQRSAGGCGLTVVHQRRGT